MTKKQISVDTVKTTQIININGNPAMVLPVGYELIELERFLPSPRRLRQHIRMSSTDSFIQYCTKFATDTSMIEVDNISKRFTARLDYHADAKTPGWCDHRAYYVCEDSFSWEEWVYFNRTELGPEKFAEFLEDRAEDIDTPSAVELLEVANKFLAPKYCSVGHPEVIAVPEVITLRLAPFHNGAPYSVKARLRYRLSQSEPILSCKLINPERVVEDAFHSVVEKVKAGLTSVTFYDSDHTATYYESLPDELTE